MRLNGRAKRLEKTFCRVGERFNLKAIVADLQRVKVWLAERKLTAVEAVRQGLQGPDGLREVTLADMAEVERQLADHCRLVTLHHLKQAEEAVQKHEQWCAANGREADQDTYWHQSLARLRAEAGLVEGQSFADVEAEFLQLQAEQDVRAECWRGNVG